MKNKFNVDLLEPVVDLGLAGKPEGPFFSILEEFTHENDVVRVLTGALYFRYHQITEPMIRTDLSPPFVTKREVSITRQIGSEQPRGAGNSQLAILNWYRVEVKATCDAMGGKDVLETVTTKERMKLWAAIYDSASLTMTKESHTGITECIPFDDIFSYDGPNHLKWRRYMRMKFVFTVEDVYKIFYSRKEGDLFQRWKGFPISNQVKAMNLGDNAQIPRKIDDALDQGRRQSVKATEYDSNYEMPISTRDYSAWSWDFDRT